MNGDIGITCPDCGSDGLSRLGDSKFKCSECNSLFSEESVISMAIPNDHIERMCRIEKIATHIFAANETIDHRNSKSGEEYHDAVEKACTLMRAVDSLSVFVITDDDDESEDEEGNLC